MKSEYIQSSKRTPNESSELFSRTTQSNLEKSAIRKLDLLLIPTLGIFFFLSFLDRSNLGNVRIIGLEDDLHMTDHDYSMALTVTFIPYILVDYPSNLVLRKIGAGIYLPFLVSVWGLVTCLQGFVSSYNGLLVARFFLGLVEGGLYPGILLYLSKFYTRSKIQLRLTLFWSTICLSGAVSGLLTFAIMNMDGYLNLKGWSWVFIIEGFFSSIFGILGFFILPSTLEKAKLLTDTERSAIALRLKEENFHDLSWVKSGTGKSVAKSTYFQAWQALKSPHVILVSAGKFMEGANVYSLAYFIPTIVKSFGHSPSQTQLLTIPIYAVAFCYLVPMSYLADRYQTRGIATCVCALLALTGFTIFYVSDVNNVRYGSLFISLAGAYGCSPCLGAWLTTNSEPYARKEVTVAVGPAIGNLGGLAEVWFFALAHKPRFALPTLLSIAFSAGIFLCSVLNIMWLTYAQRMKATKRDDMLARFTSSEEEAELEGHASEDAYDTTSGTAGARLRAALAWDELGDKHPDFKYSF